LRDVGEVDSGQQTGLKSTVIFARKAGSAKKSGLRNY